MNAPIKLSVVFVALLGLVACGSDEDVQTIECGQGTELAEDGTECVAHQEECAPGEVHDAELGLCVRGGEDYCGVGTELDDLLGRCTANPDLACGENTVDEQGECVPEMDISCGPGTVVHDGECRPGEDVCAEGTEDVPQERACRPNENICGEGTTFDIAQRQCIAISTLRCGPGTRAGDDHVCVPSQIFYEELAADADLDMTEEGATGEITLADKGESFVFVGTIDTPEEVDGELVQQQDRYHLDAEAGQWLRVTVYSLGLPEPVFEVSEQAGEQEDPLYRISDLGAGIEVTREIAVQRDAAYELTVSNMPQLMEIAPPSGGDDWNYVGYVETMETPEATELSPGDELGGDLRHTGENLYRVDEADDIASMALLFATIPEHADGELQIWSDDTTLDSVHELDDEVFSFEPPADSFYLLFDRVQAYGFDVMYSAVLEQGAPLDDGETLSEEVALDAGEFVGIFQDNVAANALAASISAGGQTLAETDALAVSTSVTGQAGLYWYATEFWAEEYDSVTVEVENTTGDHIEFVSLQHVVEPAEVLPTFDGGVLEFDHEEALDTGHRHYFAFDVEDIDDLVRIRLTDGNGHLMLMADDGESTNLQPFLEGQNLVVFEDDEQVESYVLAVEAIADTADGFTLRLDETDVIELSESSEPNIPIPDNTPSGVEDTIEIAGCNTVSEITADVAIHHSWRGDLIVRLTNPEGEQRVLKAQPGSAPFGDSSDDLIGNFNDTLDPVAGEMSQVEAEPIANFVGADGNGSWTMNVSDNHSGSTGTFVSWTLNLECGG